MKREKRTMIKKKKKTEVNATLIYFFQVYVNTSIFSQICSIVMKVASSEDASSSMMLCVEGSDIVLIVFGVLHSFNLKTFAYLILLHSQCRLTHRQI